VKKIFDLVTNLYPKERVTDGVAVIDTNHAQASASGRLSVEWYEEGAG